MAMTLTCSTNQKVGSTSLSGTITLSTSARLGPASSSTTYSFSYTLYTSKGNPTQSGPSVTRTGYGWVDNSVTFTLGSSYAGATITGGSVTITANNWTNFQNGSGIAGYNHTVSCGTYRSTSSYTPCTITFPASGSLSKTSAKISTTNKLTWYEYYGNQNAMTTSVTVTNGTYSKTYANSTITKTFNSADGDYKCELNIDVPSNVGTATCTVSGTATYGSVSSQSKTFAVYNDIAKPSTVYLGTSTTSTTTTAYVGSTNKPTSLVLRWSAVDGSGSNNAVTRYEYSADSGTTWTNAGNTTSVNITVPSTNTNYVVRAIGTYSNSPNSNAVSLTFIGSPATVTLVSPNSEDTTVSTNTTVSWNAVTVTGATIAYTVQRGTAQIYQGTSTSTTINITDLSPSVKTSIKIIATATAACGGTTSSTKTIYLTRNASLPAITITGLYDANMKNNPQGVQNYIYNDVHLTWSAITTPVSGASITYTVGFKKNNAADWTMLNVNTSSRSLNFNTFGTPLSCNEGDILQFYVHASDGYSETDVASSAVRIMSAPTFAVLHPTIVCKRETGNVKIDIAYNNDILEGDTLNCNMYLCHAGTTDGTYVSFDTASFNNQDVASYSCNHNIIPNNTGNALQSDLYNAVITKGLGQPGGKLKVVLTRDSFPQCKTEIIESFNYDYRQDITSAARFAVTSANANPGDTCRFSISANAVHKDILGNSTLNHSYITYRYEITGGNLSRQTWSSSVTDILPVAVNNTTITYTVKTIVTYADNSTVTADQTCSILVHRWTTDPTSITLLSGDGKAFSCRVNLPKTKYCDYSNYTNLTSIKCEFFVHHNSIDEPITTTGGIQTINSNFNTTDFINLNYTFTTPITDKDYQIFAKVTATNTSNQTIVLYTDRVVVRISVVDVAVRKHRLGVNINNNFGVTTGSNPDTTTGSLTVFNNPGSSDPAIEAIVDSTQSSPLVIKKGADTTVSEISIINDSFIAISNLFKTAIVTLTLQSGKTEYAISNTNITATTTQELSFYYDSTATAAVNKARYKALQKAMLVGTTQAAGSCTLQAFGSLPATNTQVKLLMIVRGG